MVAFLPLGYLMIYVGLLITISVTGVRFKTKDLLHLTLGAIFAGCILTQCVVLINPTADLYRYFAELHKYRSMDGFSSVLRNGGQNLLIGKQIYLYLVSLFSNDYMLLLCNAIIVYGCFYLILKNYLKNHPCTNRVIACSALSFMILCTFVIVTGAVCYPIVCAIMCWEIFSYYDGNKKITEVILAFLICMTIHFGVLLIFVPFVLTYLVKKNEKLRKVIIAATLCIPMIATSVGELFVKSGNLYLMALGKKILGYGPKGTIYHIDGLAGLVIFIIPILFFLMVLNCSYKNKTPCCIFSEIIVILCAGMVRYQHVAARYMSLLAFCTLPLFEEFMDGKCIRNRIVGVILFGGLIGAFLLDIKYRVGVFQSVYWFK